MTEVTVKVIAASAESAVPSFDLNVNESIPLKSAFGIYVRFGAVPLNEPCVGPDTMMKLSDAPSTSLPVSVIAFAVSSFVETDCPSAVGGSFTALTVIGKMCVTLWPSGSLACNSI